MLKLIEDKKQKNMKITVNKTSHVVYVMKNCKLKGISFLVMLIVLLILGILKSRRTTSQKCNAIYESHPNFEQT